MELYNRTAKDVGPYSVMLKDSPIVENFPQKRADLRRNLPVLYAFVENSYAFVAKNVLFRHGKGLADEVVGGNGGVA